MGLLSRMPMAGMAGQLDPRLIGHLGQGAATAQQAMQPQIDPSLAAYGQTVNGQMPSSPQAGNDAAAAAYPAWPNIDGQALSAAGMGLMQQAQPQFRAPPPMQKLDPYRFARRQG